MRGKVTHACTLTRTNAGGVVPVCSCGWIGAVHRAPRKLTSAGKPCGREWEPAERDAGAEHERHRITDGPMRATLPPEQFVGVVLNTKRFGHA